MLALQFRRTLNEADGWDRDKSKSRMNYPKGCRDLEKPRQDPGGDNCLFGESPKNGKFCSPMSAPTTATGPGAGFSNVSGSGDVKNQVQATEALLKKLAI